MAQDIRKLFENEQKVSNDKMPQGHEARFLERLDKELPEQPRKSIFTFLNIAASVVILIGLSFGAFKIINSSPDVIEGTDIVETKTESPLGKVSPELKKVEDYYLANINLELSKIEITPETKELFDGYLERLEELNKEYELLSQELTKSGPTEQTINASIENLKLRLNLMHRLKQKLNELKNDTNQLEQIQA
ncbi:hypothetical protein [Pontimicrobium sp. SW4]|uniref:DUF4179 domain-containing protein n=1 Tax=Pontimicrobium sp. SW4 TaxID=3153519 RepID=A0AAU7BV75_9FLAO